MPWRAIGTPRSGWDVTTSIPSRFNSTACSGRSNSCCRGVATMSAVEPSLLVVDDNGDNRFTLTQRLKREGYGDVVCAENGREALALMATRPFDLVLLDITMPEMDGFQVLERVKSDTTLRDTPVVMISAIDEIESVARCIRLGADDYLGKPFNPVLLRARVSACLEKKRLRDQEAAY